MATADESFAADAALPPPRARPFIAGWVAFWVLMATVAVQDHQRLGARTVWPPLVWEGTSCLVASVIAAWMWRRIPRLDAQLAQPLRWFGRALVELLWWAPLFVAAVYALRHGLFALAGATYRHEPWPVVFRYETLKFALFYTLFAAVLFGVRSHAALSAARLRAERALSLAQQAQLTQLTQQLEPHFLFNALNTIAATVHTDPALADTLITRLAALLRAATDSARRPFATLDDELRLAQAYAAIMAERFAGRVTLHWDVDDAARACRVPTLALQPLLENAFRHGVERSARAATLQVRARRQGDRLVLEVADDVGTLAAAGAPGPAPDITPGVAAAAASGVGLANLRERLAAAYGGAAALTLAPAPAGPGVVARIELPCAC
jgi:sensor histidine kinase YesM